MAKSDGGPPQSISLSQELQVTYPAKGRCYAIKETDWQYLKTKIGKMQSPSTFFQWFASVAVGAAITAIFAGLAIPESAKTLDAPTRLLCWIFTGVSLVVALVSHLCGRAQKVVLSYSKEDVLAELDRIEEPFRASLDGREPANRPPRGFDINAT